MRILNRKYLNAVVVTILALCGWVFLGNVFMGELRAWDRVVAYQVFTLVAILSGVVSGTATFCAVRRVIHSGFARLVSVPLAGGVSAALAWAVCYAVILPVSGKVSDANQGATSACLLVLYWPAITVFVGLLFGAGLGQPIHRREFPSSGE